MTSWDRYYTDYISKEEYRDRTDYDFDADYDYEAEQQRAREVLNNVKAELETKLYEVLDSIGLKLEDEEIQKIYFYDMFEETLEETVSYFSDDKYKIKLEPNHKKILDER